MDMCSFAVLTCKEAPSVTPPLRCPFGLLRNDDTAFLIIDGESPDAVVRPAREFVRGGGHGRARLPQGRRRGFGGAYTGGVIHPLSVPGADAVARMDVDFSHDFTDVRNFPVHAATGAAGKLRD